jgi:hypothetical protein
MSVERAGIGLALLADLIAAKKLRPQIAVEAPWSEIGTVARRLIDREFTGKAVLQNGAWSARLNVIHPYHPRSCAGVSQRSLARPTNPLIGHSPFGIDGGDEAVHKASHPKSSSQVTLCWREMDSNFRFPNRFAPVFESGRAESGCPRKSGFATDSALEGDGFEPSVPHEGPTRRDGFIRLSSGGSEAHHRRSAISTARSGRRSPPGP